MFRLIVRGRYTVFINPLCPLEPMTVINLHGKDSVQCWKSYRISQIADYCARTVIPCSTGNTVLCHCLSSFISTVLSEALRGKVFPFPSKLY